MIEALGRAVIRGQQSADLVHAGGGQDRVYADPGADDVFGEGGDDRIFDRYSVDDRWCRQDACFPDSKLHRGHEVTDMIAGIAKVLKENPV
jgi:hypothetical protein